MQQSMRIRARWLVDAAGMFREDVRLEIAGGIIRSVMEGRQPDATDLGDVAILPGLVNAHLHLDLSAMDRSSLPADSFTDWLTAVVRHRGVAPQQDTAKAITTHLEQLAGTTLVGDIAADAASIPLLARSGRAGVVFREVLGLRAERYEPLWNSALADIGQETDLVKVSLSPHAPYSTSRTIYHRAAALASRPLATHWYETPEEVELLRTGRGPFREFLERIGAWTDDWRPTDDPWNDYFPPDHSGRWILVHGNCLDAADIERLCHPSFRPRIAGVVYCPRTHAYFDRGPHPYLKLRAAGIPVGLGTDSLASNPDLSVFEEAKFLASHDSAVSPLELLQMLTLDGWRLLGIGSRSGRIAVGQIADLAIVRPSSAKDLLENLFAPEAQVVGTMANGKWLGKLTTSG